MVWLLLRQRTVILDMIRDKKTPGSDRGFFCGGSAVLPAGLSVRDPVDEFRNGYGASEYFRAADRYLRLYHDEDASRPAAGDFHRPGSVRRLSACYGGKTGQSGAVCAGPFMGSGGCSGSSLLLSSFPRAGGALGKYSRDRHGSVCRRIIFFTVIRAWYIPEGFDAGAFVLMLLIILVGTVGAFSLFLQEIRLVGPVKAILLGCLEPLTAAFLFCRLDGLLLFSCGLHRVCGNSGHRRSSEIVPVKSLEDKDRAGYLGKIFKKRSRRQLCRRFCL